MELIRTVQRQEFDTSLDLVGKPVYYKGNGVLGNELVPLDQYVLVTQVSKTIIEVVDAKKRSILLDLTQVNAAEAFTLVVLGNDEDLVAPGTEPNA